MEAHPLKEYHYCNSRTLEMTFDIQPNYGGWIVLNHEVVCLTVWVCYPTCWCEIPSQIPCTSWMYHMIIHLAKENAKDAMPTNTPLAIICLIQRSDHRYTSHRQNAIRRLPSLKLTRHSPLKMGPNPKGKACFPTTNFQV